jgi:16S rRNA (cytosine967-C5)-methyltransferase
VELVVADAIDWATQELAARRPAFDRILLDAPCTASGIVRRHPDIPWLRQSADVAKLANQQHQLLDALWPLLRPAGRLLYVVCSVFPQEGGEQVRDFLRRHADARALPLPVAAADSEGLQLLPSPDPASAPVSGLPTTHDGFYFALIEKV